MWFGLSFMQQETTSSVLIYGVVLCQYYLTKAATQSKKKCERHESRVVYARSIFNAAA